MGHNVEYSINIYINLKTICFHDDFSILDIWIFPKMILTSYKKLKCGGRSILSPPSDQL